jgi:hypothetical protein
MATDDRRTCPIFRIERGTFQESHRRTLNFDYPSLSDDENIFLRVTKLSSPGTSTPSSMYQSNKRFDLSMISSHETWNDSGLSFDDSSTSRARLHSLSDDYVFL